MFDTLIQHADVIRTSPAGVSVQHDQDIAIRGTQIAAIEPSGRIEPGHAHTLMYAHGMIAMPGMINAHCHSPMVLFRGLAEDVTIERWFNEYIWPVESNLTAEDVYWGALLGIAEMIEAGVTSVADHYFFMESVARAVQKSGIRANLVTALFGNTAEDLHKLDQASHFVEHWQGAADGRITTWLGPHAPYTCSDSFLQSVAARAKTLGVGTHIHVSETREQVQASLAKTGRTPIEVLRDTGILDVPTICAHAAHATEADLTILAEHGTGVAHCPKTFLKLAAGMAPVLAMRARGIPVGIGTDGAASNGTLDVLEAMRLAVMLQKHERRDSTVATVAEGLQMALVDGARVLRQETQLGDLAPGKLADLILISTEGAHMQPHFSLTANLVYSARASDVDTVFCNGQLLMHNRRLLTLDKALIRAEVAARLERLQARVPGQRIQTYQP